VKPNSTEYNTRDGMLDDTNARRVVASPQLGPDAIPKTEKWRDREIF
jgi:hypothetical protein